MNLNRRPGTARSLDVGRILQRRRQAPGMHVGPRQDESLFDAGPRLVWIPQEPQALRQVRPHIHLYIDPHLDAAPVVLGGREGEGLLPVGPGHRQIPAAERDVPQPQVRLLAVQPVANLLAYA
jgi:hypothetical protein